ncbi:MAG: hypothetical protein WC533_00725 [Candidatus Pacearchaeota archaeon]
MGRKEYRITLKYKRELKNIRVVSYCSTLDCELQHVFTDVYYGWFFGKKEVPEDIARKDPNIRRARLENEEAMYDGYEMSPKHTDTHTIRLRGYY